MPPGPSIDAKGPFLTIFVAVMVVFIVLPSPILFAAEENFAAWKLMKTSANTQGSASFRARGRHFETPNPFRGTFSA
jgi:hypothetical protein